MSVTDEIKARLDIVEVVGSYVQLKKAGRTFKGLCPFHAEKTPSFVVNPDRQTWHCFGSCGTGGDIFTFIQRAENVDFPEALRLLAERAGVELRPRTPTDQAEDETRQRLFDIHAAAASLFYNTLLAAPAAAPARAYLAQRQVDDATRDRFGLGYALDSWDHLLTSLQARGYRPDEVAQAGLAVEREGGGHYDRFRARLVFPIRDERGRVIGFGGRTLADAVPKYLNSPQTPLFDKGAGLYALDLAKDAIRRTGVAVVVEGYMDVVSLHQRGFHNVVASLGTALTEAQVALAARHAGTLVLALDADTAGNAATLRGLQVAAQAVAVQRRRMPGPGGRLNTVEKRAVELRIALLPPGLDPDDLVKQNPAEWERRVAQAKPVPDYYFTALVSDLDLGTPRGKAEAVTRLLQVIRDELDSPVEQAHYLQWLARLTRVDERELAQQFRTLRRTPGPHLTPNPSPTRGGGRGEVSPPPLVGEGAGGRGQSSSPHGNAGPPHWNTNGAPSPSGRAARGEGEDLPPPFGGEGARGRGKTAPRLFGREEYILGLLLRTPHALAVVQKALTDQGMPPLGAADFSQADNQALLQSLADAPPADGVLAAHLAFVEQGMARAPVLQDDAVEREALITLLRLREQQRKQELTQLEYLQADAAADGDEASVSRYAVRVQHVSLDLERVQRALTQTLRNPVPTR